MTHWSHKVLHKFHVWRRRFWVVEVKQGANCHIAEVNQPLFMHVTHLKQ
jgi:hypothetical protein